MTNKPKNKGRGYCKWRSDQDYDENIHWDTSCETTQYFEEGEVFENGYNFCPYCGKKIKVVE